MSSLPQPLPLFPLQTVLFPGALLGLKVFEARYLDLVSECLRTQQPFGVICLRQGAEAGRAGKVELEQVGVLARIDEVDAEQAGILRLRCIGGSRFRLTGPPTQRASGLWEAPAEVVADDPQRLPGPAMLATVQALAEAIRKLQQQDKRPFAEPYRLDDAGWVANRWCELLPVSLAAKQKLMELDDPVIRLSLVDGFLRDKKVVVG
ncbi:MAG: LON peptidase substrate-binding domain-containing protein [Rubrivivax sp.]|nr:LON peptidase substrate-binding domain-containing protein [Rubrivivax sp.]